MLSVSLVLVMLCVALTACGSKKDDQTGTTDNTGNETTNEATTDNTDNTDTNDTDDNTQAGADTDTTNEIGRAHV